MVDTAEATALDGGFTRQQGDELTLMRYEQYQSALANDRAIQLGYFKPIVIKGRKANTVIDQHEGVGPYSADGLRRLRSSLADGVTTPGSQTHPADGVCGMAVTSRDQARQLQHPNFADVSIVRAGFARA